MEGGDERAACQHPAGSVQLLLSQLHGGPHALDLLLGRLVGALQGRQLRPQSLRHAIVEETSREEHEAVKVSSILPVAVPAPVLLDLCCAHAKIVDLVHRGFIQAPRQLNLDGNGRVLFAPKVTFCVSFFDNFAFAINYIILKCQSY
jgi:hypothetical protein